MENPHPSLGLSKNSIVEASWDDSAFQLRLDAHGNKIGDKLGIETVDIFGFPCVPNVGVYGDDYTPCIPTVLICAPAAPSVFKTPLFNKISSELGNIGFKCGKEEGIESNPSVQIFILVHSKPILGPCQKFLCENVDEVNMMYHPWLFGSIQLTEDTTISRQLNMGIFHATNIKPVHQNLKDAGISFGKLENRTVALHGLRFSPENAQFQLSPSSVDGEGAIAHFVAVAIDKESPTPRYAISYHVIPTTDHVESQLSHAAHTAQTVSDLIANLQVIFPTISNTIYTIITALNG